MAVNMKDIARELGVSPVTVSKALRNHPDISKATKERIEQCVKQLGYRPNLMARSLVTGRSSLVGLIVPDLIHPFFAEIAKGLSMTLRESGYFLLTSSSEEDPLLEVQEIEHMLAHRLDAMVIASCQRSPEPLRSVAADGTPVILVDRFFDDFPCHFVGSDDYAAGKLATEHLIAAGCKRIAHIRGPENSVGNRRCKSFLDTMARHKLRVPDDHVLSARTVDVEGRERGAEAVRHLLELKKMPDAIFCYNDVVAMGVIREAAALGVRVPEDLAVIGCGNLHFNDFIRVPLSSIDQRSPEIGSRAAKLILQLLSSEAPTDFKRIVLQPRLAARESSRHVEAKQTRTARPRAAAR